MKTRALQYNAEPRPLTQAKPQPPQLAPERVDSTSSINGFSSTLNFCATMYKITAKMPPKTPSTMRE